MTAASTRICSASTRRSSAPTQPASSTTFSCRPRRSTGSSIRTRRDTQHSFGAYLLAQQQLNRDWYAGLRLDWTQNALNEHQEVWGVSPYVSWYWSEFLRWRVEYQHKGGDVRHEDTVYFQLTWIFGAHPPHPYWAMH